MRSKQLCIRLDGAVNGGQSLTLYGGCEAGHCEQWLLLRVVHRDSFRGGKHLAALAVPFDHADKATQRSEEHTSELQSRGHLVCRLLLEKKKEQYTGYITSMESL